MNQVFYHMTIIPVSFLKIVILTVNILVTVVGSSLGVEVKDVTDSAQSIIRKHCLSCHGASQISGLDLRQRGTLLKGGDRGKIVDLQNPRKSLLYQAAAHLNELKMPPGSSAPLPEAELSILREWIKAGVPYPELRDLQAETFWWSFKKLQQPLIPRLKKEDQPFNPIDAFILEKLQDNRLEPAPQASKITLLRRVYFDLVGLPPTLEQANRFLQDSSPNAYEKLIEELLNSPRYGERWGRHWLDVVRYADSAGFEGDLFYPNAWRYRDYVVKSFNEDKPYDRFVQEQIAGDELFPNNMDLEGFYDLSPEKLEHMEARVGTTLYTFGPEIGESHLDAELLRYERLTDAVNVTSAAFMGITLECSRCHNHKFDPFTQEDYFKLQAVFAASIPTTIPVETTINMGHRDESYHLIIALIEARNSYLRFEEQIKNRVIKTKKKDYAREVVTAYEIPMEERTAEELELAEPLMKLYQEMKIEDFLKSEESEHHKKLIQKIAKAVVIIPSQGPAHAVDFDGFFDVPSATVLEHVKPELIPETYLLNRGELTLKRRVVSPGLPRSLMDGSIPMNLSMEVSGARYRKQLALWLTRPNHPLTARVMVNRIWQGHFGKGIVRTTNDFGSQGDPPSHPKLLDWLAAEFVNRGWSIKSIHRLIMLSDAYQRDSRFTTMKHRQKDSDNRYLWRMNRRRLEGETIWDSIHTVAGNLNLKMGGRAAIPPLSEVEMSSLRHKPWWAVSEDPSAGRRRGIYILARRNFTFPMFDKFDVPNSSVSCSGREVTTVTPQVLWTLNNNISFDQAQVLANRLLKEAGQDEADQIELAWRLTLARKPSAREKQEALALLHRLALKEEQQLDKSVPQKLPKPQIKQLQGLSQFCLAMFNLSEFLYVD